MFRLVCRNAFNLLKENHETGNFYRRRIRHDGIGIHSKLSNRDDIELLHLPESDRKHAGARAAAINACDITILCLPDEAARRRGL